MPFTPYKFQQVQIPNFHKFHEKFIGSLSVVYRQNVLGNCVGFLWDIRGKNVGEYSGKVEQNSCGNCAYKMRIKMHKNALIKCHINRYIKSV
jgi:hypothetical protein